MIKDLRDKKFKKKFMKINGKLFIVFHFIYEGCLAF